MNSVALPQISTIKLHTTVNARPSMYISNIRSGLTSTTTSIGLLEVGERYPNVAIDTYGSFAHTYFTGGNVVVIVGQSVPGMNYGGVIV